MDKQTKYEINNVIKVIDKTNRITLAVIRNVYKNGSIKIHFLNFDSRHDEIISNKSERIINNYDYVHCERVDFRLSLDSKWQKGTIEDFYDDNALSSSYLSVIEKDTNKRYKVKNNSDYVTSFGFYTRRTNEDFKYVEKYLNIRTVVMNGKNSLESSIDDYLSSGLENSKNMSKNEEKDILKTNLILKQNGFRRIQVPADHHCFYHCLAKVIFPSNSNNQFTSIQKVNFLRNRVYNLILESELYMQHLKRVNTLNANSTSEEIERCANKYLKNIKKNEWAGNLEISVIVNAYNLNIIIISKINTRDGIKIKKCREFSGTKSDSDSNVKKKTIYLLYDGAHYDYLEKHQDDIEDKFNQDASVENDDIKKKCAQVIEDGSMTFKSEKDDGISYLLQQINSLSDINNGKDKKECYNQILELIQNKAILDSKLKEK